MPPFSPALLVGLLLRPIPKALLRPPLALAMDRMVRRHPRVFERLRHLAGALVVIDPVDLPFALALDFAPPPRGPGLRVATESDAAAARATVRGPLAALVDLLEARLDGDALFFSRDLTIEGDTEAIVALRNAVDGEEIRLAEDLASILGPLGGPARDLAALAGRVLGQAARDLERLRAAVVAPALHRSDVLAGDLQRLRDRVAALERRRAPARRAEPGGGA